MEITWKREATGVDGDTHYIGLLDGQRVATIDASTDTEYIAPRNCRYTTRTRTERKFRVRMSTPDGLAKATYSTLKDAKRFVARRV